MHFSLFTLKLKTSGCELTEMTNRTLEIYWEGLLVVSFSPKPNQELLTNIEMIPTSRNCYLTSKVAVVRS